MASNEEIWPTFRASWILYEDDALIVINKPARVSSEAAKAEVPDDIVSRLKAFLASRGDDSYLGIHQRLDRDTSGVLVYARQKAANASLAEQFEKRLAAKRYVAAVENYRGPKAQVLRHRLLPLTRGRVEVAGPHDRRGLDAETRIEVIAEVGSRTLLRCELVTGRTHQIRVQLSAIGCAVAGDSLYGAVPASRMLLHAEDIALIHPLDGRKLSFSAPLPPAFDAWMRDAEVFDADMGLFNSALEDALLARYALGRLSEAGDKTDAFRLVNEDGDGMPGFALDAYGRALVAHFYSERCVEHRERILDAVASLGFDSVYAKFRPRQANVIVDSAREEYAPAEPVRGQATDAEFVVHERGIPYLVRLGDGLSTGIFLDQRENRSRVRELARGATVLNLFSYTCAFSSAALVGGAARVVSVDASRDVLERGARNVALLENISGSHETIAADVFDVLERYAKGRTRFDLVVVDPPTYSTTKVSRFRSGNDWRPLAELVLRVTASNGRVLFCSNDRRMVLKKFRRLLHEGAADAGRAVQQMKDIATPRDFPVAAGAESHLKSVLVTVA